jgi:hypothetical protein
MASLTIPLPNLGIDMLANQTVMRSGTVRYAANVDIRTDGVFSRRDGYALKVGGSGFKGVYSSSRGTLVQRGNFIYVYNDSTYALSMLCDMGGDTPASFLDYAEGLYICNETAHFWIPSTGTPSVRKVGVSLPDRLPEVVASSAGTLAPGKYGIGYAWVDDRGEESPTKFLGVFELTAGVTLSGLTVKSGYSHRIYITTKDGEALYLADEWPALLTTYNVNTATNGALCSGLHLSPMPCGQLVKGSSGRLYVAKDDTLWFSEPLRPHLTRLSHNFVKFVGQIRFFEAIGPGVYVGDDAGVWWFDGTDPEKFQMRNASNALAIKRSSLSVAASIFGDRFRNTENTVALWLSTQGYMVGSPNGEVTPLHPERVRLAADLEGKSVFLLRNGIRQVITLTAAAVPADPIFGAAIDTPLQ